MEGRHISLERRWRRREEKNGKVPSAPPPPPPPPPPAVPPPSALDCRPQKRSTYGLQRDYRVLEREKKVTAVLENSGFRAELENILKEQLGGKTKPMPRPSPDQWLADLHHSALHAGARQPVATRLGHGGVVVPINDLSGGLFAAKYTVAEREARCKLAAVYRLLDMFGWSQLIDNHVTASAPGGREAGYYISAYGLMYSEVTASNLVHVDLEGNILDPGSTQLGVNGPGVHLHSAIHKSRGDIKCAIHLHSTATVAISAVNCGLLRISSEANAVGCVSHCDLWEVEREDMDHEIARTLETASKVLVLRNHGVVALGGSIEEAFSVAYNLVKACEIQVAAMSAGITHLNKERDWSELSSTTSHGQTSHVQQREGGGGVLEWKTGELQFEALMRMLDSKGYKTGYNYKGLSLLQRGNGDDSKASNQQGSTGKAVRDEAGTGKKAEPIIKGAKRPHPDPGKELWEFIAEDGKTPVPKTEPAKTKTSVTSRSQIPAAAALGESESTSTDDEQLTPRPSPRGNDLDAVAEKVAKSTGDVAQRLAQSGGRELSALELAEITAERVARSTGDALQKLATNQEDVASSDEGELQKTAKHVAKSTADTLQKVFDTREEQNLSDVAREEAKKVAESTTNNSVEKLNSKNEELDLLEMTRLTAKHVAVSTSEAVRRLRFEDQNCTDEGMLSDSDYSRTNSLPDLLKQYPFVPITESEISPPVSLAPNGMSQYENLHQTPAEDETRRLPSPPVAQQANNTTTPSNAATSLQSYDRTLPPTPSDTATVLQSYDRTLPPTPSDTATVLQSYDRILPPTPSDTATVLQSYDRTLPPIPFDTATVLQSYDRTLPLTPSNRATVYDRTLPPTLSDTATVLQTYDRTLPTVPAIVQQKALPQQPVSSRRQLPTMKPSLGIIPSSFTRGYQHSLALPKQNDETVDSDSEYSTTESVELTSKLLTPAYYSTREKPATADSDLKTNPMKRMSHTAEMVAESTGKAVHMLTSTLSA